MVLGLVADLSPHTGIPLRTLACDFKRERDVLILRSLTTLEAINGRPVRDFWKDVEATKP